MRGLSATVALAACLVAVGCGARTADEGAIDAKGVLVFSGLPSGPFLHSIRPDGTSLIGASLPETCSPEAFARHGDVLVCLDLGDHDLDQWQYAVDREGGEWRRVPMPDEVRFPDWVEPLGEHSDAPQWSPGRDRIVFIRPNDDPFWLSATGDVVVAQADGSGERVVARLGEDPKWSPDGNRLAFARCKLLVDEPDKVFTKDAYHCSLWTVSADGSAPPHLVADDTASGPVWSPDGRFLAFFRYERPCTTFCRERIAVVSVEGGKSVDVGPALVQPADDRSGYWQGLAWLPDSAGAVVPEAAKPSDNALELQRCVDIWNRARMKPWGTGAVNVSLVEGRCQVTLSYYGGVCPQMPENPYRYNCPAHGAGLHQLPPAVRVWNAQGAEDGELILFDPPKGERLPLPKAPPYPLLDGFVIPYGKDGEPLADLKLTRPESERSCDTWLPPSDRDPVVFCSTYDECFKRPGRLEVGDTVLCPAWTDSGALDPMGFVAVRVTSRT